MKFGYRVLSALAAVLLCSTSVAAQNSVEGSYICKTTRGAACMTNTPLQLVNGNWRWGAYSGSYQISAGRVVFSGVGGAASWGYAIIGADSLNFNQFGDNSIWEKPSSTPQSVLGTYYCQTAPTGCMTNQPIVLRADGTYTWGPIHGSYGMVGGQLQFAGPTEGPGGWGHASVGNGSISFIAPNGSTSVWAKRAN
jgi:hypothetical protein